MDYVCYPYESITINHFIVPIWTDVKSQPILHKFTFIGEYPPEIMEIITKIEHQTKLAKDEINKLNSAIPRWNSLFGDISSKYELHFIYSFIEDNMPIFHIISIFETILRKYIKELTLNDVKIQNQLIYKYNRNISYRQLVKYINYIFNDNSVIDAAIFNKKIYDMTYLSHDELDTKIRTLLPEKYKPSEPIAFLNKTNYKYVDCLHSEELLHILLDIPSVLTYSYDTDKQYPYYGNVILPSLLMNGIHHKLEHIPSDIINDNMYRHLYKNLSYYGKTTNNEYYIILKSMMELFIDDVEYIKLFYDDLKTILTIDTELFAAKDTMINNRNLQITQCMTRNLILDFNSIETNTSINLGKIFSHYNTDDFLPVIKYYINGNPYKYKFYQTFLTSHSSIQNKKILANIGSSYGNFLQFKWFITGGRIITIELFDNLFIRMYIDEDNFQSISTGIIPYLDVLTITIKKIKKIMNIVYFTIPNIRSIFQEHSGVLYNYNIVGGNILIKGTINKTINYEIPIFINKFVSIIKSYTQFVITDILGDTIKLFYKQIDDFYHIDNVNKFIKNMITKHNFNINNKDDREKIVKNLTNIFMLNIDVARNYVIKWKNDISQQDSASQNVMELIGINVRLKIFSNNTFEFEINDNLDSFSTIKKILYYIETVINNFDNIKTFSIKQHHKHIDSTKLDDSIAVPLFDFDSLQLDYPLLDSISTKSSASISTPTSASASTSSESHKGLKLQKLIAGDRILRINTYITQLRRLFDPELDDMLNKIKKRTSVCDKTQMRIPYPVSKQDLDMFDPESFNGYIKYRNNYYICPRLWDYKANKPISINAFINAGLKSPYSGGKIVKNNILDDIHTVILRKHANYGSYWGDANIEKTLPPEFRSSGREAYPGLTQTSQNVCVPCCFKKIPADFDPLKKEIQQVFQYQGADECRTDSDKKVELSLDICLNEVNIYIISETNQLTKCRFGQLPKNINLLLNNHQEYFINKADTFNEHCNFLLRRGVNQDEKYNFLESIATIANITLDNLKNKIASKLDLKLFISLNNGELIDIYSTSNILPNTIMDYENFREFANRERLFFNLLDIDFAIIEKLDFAKILDVDDSNDIKKIMIMYKIFKSYYNYIKHLLNSNEYKNYTHYIDLCSRPLEWLFPSGVNIIIFDKHGDTIQCNPFLKSYNKKFIFLIRDTDYLFIPIYHIIMQKKLNANGINGVIDIDMLDIDSTTYHYYKSVMRTPSDILNLMQKRQENVLNLILIHQDICESEIQFETKKLLNELNKAKFKVNYSVLATTTQCEYIIIKSGIMLPIYPCGIEIEYGRIKLLNEVVYSSLDTYIDIFKLSNLYLIAQDRKNKDLRGLSESKLSSDQQSPTISTSDDTIPPIYEMANILLHYDYIVKNILIDELNDLIIGIRFYNGLIVPVKPEKITITRKREIMNALDYNDRYISQMGHFTAKGTTSNYDIVQVKNILSEIILNIWEYTMIKFPIISSKINLLNIKKLIISDYSYNHFKYEFSRILQESSSKKYKKLLLNMLNNISMKLINNDINIYEISDLIAKIMNGFVVINNSVSPATTSASVTVSTSTSTSTGLMLCYKASKKCGELSPFCATDNGKTKKKTKKVSNKLGNCKINITDAYYEYFIYLLANDLINNISERDEIFDASFIPQYYNRNYLVMNTKEIIINSDDIAEILDKGLFSKYKKNIQLSNMLFKSDKKYYLKPSEIMEIDQERRQQLTNLYNQVITDMENANLRNIKPSDAIIATPFDKNGHLDSRYGYGECIFPFFGRNRRLNPHCVNSMLGYRCPIQVNYKRIPTKWGYCPEKPDATKMRNPTHIPIKAVDGGDKLYQEGNCVFPHLAKKEDIAKKPTHSADASADTATDLESYELRYTCNEVRTGNKDNWFSWCPTKLAYDPLEFPLYPAAEKLENIIIGKYKKSRLFIPATTQKSHHRGGVQLSSSTKQIINPIYTETRKRGYCKLPNKMIVEPEIKEGIRKITLANYNPQKCSLPESKEGYTKDELYYFGVNELKIPQTNLLKDINSNKKKEKPELCLIINRKVREIQTPTTKTDADRVHIYKKDLNKCIQGKSKGGYNMLELREMGINYFGLDEVKALPMSKVDLCNYIIPIIKRIKNEDVEIMSPENDGNDEMRNKGYPGDITKCKDTGKKGGMSANKVKQIAINNFKLNIEGLHLHKNEICDLIAAKLEEMKKEEITKKKGGIVAVKEGDEGDKFDADIPSVALTLEDIKNMMKE